MMGGPPTKGKAPLELQGPLSFFTPRDANKFHAGIKTKKAGSVNPNMNMTQPGFMPGGGAAAANALNNSVNIKPGSTTETSGNGRKLFKSVVTPGSTTNGMTPLNRTFFVSRAKKQQLIQAHNHHYYFYQQFKPPSPPPPLNNTIVVSGNGHQNFNPVQVPRSGGTHSSITRDKLNTALAG